MLITALHRTVNLAHVQCECHAGNKMSLQELKN